MTIIECFWTLGSVVEAGLAWGRGLHSFNFQLNMSACCDVGGMFRGCSGGVSEESERIRVCFRIRNGSG